MTLLLHGFDPFSARRRFLRVLQRSAAESAGAHRLSCNEGLALGGRHADGSDEPHRLRGADGFDGSAEFCKVCGWKIAYPTIEKSS